jgi:non-heme chloroperoxidase
MGTITVKDGKEIFYKDWGSGQPIVFHHGWPLSADDWDAQMISSCSMATGSSRMTAAAMAGHRRPLPAMKWTLMPTMWRRWPQHST